MTTPDGYETANDENTAVAAPDTAAAARPPRTRRPSAAKEQQASPEGERGAVPPDATAPDLSVEPAAPPPQSGPPVSLGALAMSVLREEFAALREPEARVRASGDPDGIHDMRVALRRLRAALSLFSDALPASFEPFRGDFGWIARSLGAVRDVDVLIERLRQPSRRGGQDGQRSFNTILAWFEAERTAARHELLATLSAERYASVLADFAALLDADLQAEGDPGDQPAVVAAPALIRKRYRQLRAAGDALTPKSDAADYHRLRIRAKRLRYTLDFLRGVYGEAVRPLRRRLAELQGLLGDFQDMQVARTRLRDLQRLHGDELTPDDRAGLDELRRQFKREAAELRRDFPARYQRVTGAEWQRLRLVLDVRRERALRHREGAET